MATSTRPQPHPEIGTELIRDWEPGRPPKAYIVLVHGMAEHSGRYERTGALLSVAGFHVRGFDLIGAGGSGGRRWDIDQWSRFHDQVQTHIEWAKESGKTVALMGHSLGGNIALGYALDDRPSPDLLILSAPALGGAAEWQKVAITLGARLLPTLAIPNPFPADVISRDPDVVTQYEDDPLVIPKTTLRLWKLFLDQMDHLNERLEELDIPTLVIHGGEDELMPTWTSEPFADLEICERRVYDGLRHETLNEPEGPEVVADIVDWLNSRLSDI
jgi:alpha-beta hydrolase superfamily lysophospholipase